VLRAYGVPVVTNRTAATPAEAGAMAEEIGGPVALKIRSRDIVHKSDIGGVVLDQTGAAAVQAAGEAMLDRIRAALPDARLDGFSVEQMIDRPEALELIAGISVDPTFGPVVLFGQGGVAVEAIGDTALALPPLDQDLARGLVARTRVARLLKGYRNRRPADMDAIVALLVAVAQLAMDHREIAELDINPFLADATGVIAIDARIRLTDPAKAVPAAILPYPHEIEQFITARDGATVTMRPIKPTDADGLLRMHARLAPADIRARFHGYMRDLQPSLLSRLTQIDYDREMALIGFAAGDPVPLGVVRLHADPDNQRAEFAIVVRSDWHGRGLGTAMMNAIIAHGRMRGIAQIDGSILRDNTPMLTMAHELGFVVTAQEGDEVIVTLDLMAREEKDADSGANGEPAAGSST